MKKLKANVFIDNKIMIGIIIFTIIMVITSCCINANRNPDTTSENQAKVFESETINSQKSYSEIFAEIEDLQAQYWQIIKRNNLLINQDFNRNNKEIEKDKKELTHLFNVAQSRIDKNNYYLLKLQEIDKKYENNNSETQYDMNMFAGEYNDKVDEILNELYKQIRTTIPEDDFNNLKLSERQWLKDIETYKKVFYSEDRGSIGGMTYSYMLANMRKFRVLLLIPYLNNNVLSKNNIPTNNISVQKADYLGTWEDLYSQRANCTIKELKNYIKTEINWSSSAVENTKWIFECQYDSNTGDLMCKNGKQIDSYPVKNGVRIYGAGDDPDYMEEKIVKQNLQTSIKIKKGNLKSALNEVDYMGDKDEALNFYKNMTLKINLQDLSKNIFVK
ncbi:DUF1311 domain-containing protein [bacterium]|nr:DUF1311 domain-containing protein [bacterium]